VGGKPLGAKDLLVEPESASAAGWVDSDQALDQFGFRPRLERDDQPTVGGKLLPFADIVGPSRLLVGATATSSPAQVEGQAHDVACEVWVNPKGGLN
jgi:hypothetical protein